MSILKNSLLIKSKSVARPKELSLGAPNVEKLSPASEQEEQYCVSSERMDQALVAMLHGYFCKQLMNSMKLVIPLHLIVLVNSHQR